MYRESQVPMSFLCSRGLARAERVTLDHAGTSHARSSHVGGRQCPMDAFNGGTAYFVAKSDLSILFE